MNNNKTINIDGKDIPIENEKNLLEIIRKAGIDIPTFCYHSELSVYGACRLCMVNIENMGLQPSCSTPPVNGMKIKTNTEEIRKMRKIILELLLANEGHDCTVCPKNGNCQLQNLARKMGITQIRFKKKTKIKPIDKSTFSLIRDPNKCVLCGDCVRFCSEIQGIGAIDFAYRGKDSIVMPAFGKDLDKVECVNCGQCARVCPTGAITIKENIQEVWNEIDNPEKVVIAQIAPAVRIALGEKFGLEPGHTTTGHIVAALKCLGFDRVYDTSFTADLTVIEEGNEFLERLQNAKEKLPQFTSCCPAWVKFVEQYYPEYIENLSTCKSPQGMFGSLAKKILPDTLKTDKKNIVVVSIMPCTAKKYEAKRPELYNENNPDVDYVITTQELAKMIDQAGLDFNNLAPESFDLPFGFKTGAGIIFGASGGVTEAVIRYLKDKVDNANYDNYEVNEIRNNNGIKELNLKLSGGKVVRVAAVAGLNNAKKLIQDIKNNKKQFDFIEVMSCPGGCIGGAGQPCYKEVDVRKKRAKGIYENDKMSQMHKSQENPYINELYSKYLNNDRHLIHSLLHTHYSSKKRIINEGYSMTENRETAKIKIDVCFGTNCFIKGSQKIMTAMMEYITEKKAGNHVDIKASFCFENCGKSPNIKIQGKLIDNCTIDKAIKVLEEEIKKIEVPN